jgi:TonB family protein
MVRMKRTLRKIPLIALIVFPLACLLGAQPPTSPRVSHKVEAQYSEEARRARLEGTVLLRIVVGADGTPRDLSVVRGLGLGLDENAIAAVSKWRFTPGTKGGEAVDVQAQIEVVFRPLDDPNVGWRVTRIDFHLPTGFMRPVVIKTAAPQSTEYAVSAKATATFDIDEKGAPVNIRTDKSSDGEWAHAVTEALKSWKFTPATENGRPVSVSCSMDFVRGAYLP